MKDARGNVMVLRETNKKPWQEAAPEFPIPDHRESVAPRHVVPEPDEWPEPDTWDMPPVPPAIECGGLGDTRTVAMIDIAKRIITATQERHESLATADGLFWLYDKGYHHKLPQCWIDEAIISYDGVRPKNDEEPSFRADPRTVPGVASMIERLLRIQQKQVPGRWLDEPEALVFSNGSLAFDTLELEPHSFSHRASSGFDDVAYERGLVPTHLPLVMRDWFAGESEEEIEARILAIRQYAGHVILGTLSRMKLSLGLMLVGGGHDGKSALLDVIKGCLPPGSCSSVDPAELCSKSLAVDITRASLIGKRANICGDCTAQTWHDTGFLKRMHDHDEVSVRRQGRDAQTFKCDLGALYACNELPRVLDTSHGFYRRWRLIHFPNRVPENVRDPALVRKLMAHERPAIVCWFVDAALDMLRGNQSATIAEPACHRMLLARWQSGEDSVMRFVEERCESPGENEELWTRGQDLYDAYCAWHLHMFGDARKAMSRDAFGKRISAMGLPHSRRGKNRDRVVKIALKSR